MQLASSLLYRSSWVSSPAAAMVRFRSACLHGGPTATTIQAVPPAAAASSTSSSGTALSTPYTNCSTSTPQSSDGLDDVMLLDLSCCGVGQDREQKLQYMRCLFREFSAADGDVSVLDKWLADEMGVGRRHTSSTLPQSAATRSWMIIRALTEISASIRTMLLADDMSSFSSVVEEGRPAQAQHVQLARFAQASILKMLPFIDAVLVSHHYSCTTNTGSGGGEMAAGPAEAAGAADDAEKKLRSLIGVREALSGASENIRLSFCSTTSEDARRITDEMASLVVEKEAKLDEAIWKTMEDARTRLLLLAPAEDDGNPCGGGGTTQTQAGSGDIHKLTRATVSYVDLLSTNRATLHQVVNRYQVMPETDDNTASPLTTMIMEVVSCLEQKLAKMSESFPDQSLRFLFLINNSHFIWQKLFYPSSVLGSHMAVLARRVDNYIQTYLQVAWAPVVSCLYNSTPLCMGRYCSPAKFESEFQRTYTAQKLWKVPDPKLRRRLRVDVVEKVISNYTKYLEYNNIRPSRMTMTPQDLMDMLQDLFEG